ncbi:serine hydrolase domain-containing protein [Aliiglaciecola aliphaticivorans]
MNHFIALAVLVTLSAPFNLSAKDTHVLQRLQSVKKELKEGESHNYFIKAAENHFIFGEVEQDTIDVKIQLFDPKGTEIKAYNSTEIGSEPFTLDTKKAGDYKVVVSSFGESAAGRYSIQLVRNEAIPEDPDKRLEQLLSPYDKEATPGGIIGVFEKGQTTHVHSAGMANIAHGVAFTPDMPTNIGSVSKQFTGMAMLLLEQQGKLSLDDNLRQYFPELPDFSADITIRNLLTHTSGLREIFDFLGMRGWTGEEFIDKHQAIEIVKKQAKLQSAPGEKMNYNNTGFILMALLVERVSGQPFSDWMQANIFEPLHMKNTYVRRDPGHIIPNAVQGYDNDKNGFREAGDLYSAPGAGGIYTTVADMAKWSQNYITGELGGKELITKLTTPGVLNNGEPQTYALGLGVEDYKGLLRYEHGGADMAHYTNYAFFPKLEKGVFLNTNNTAFNMAMWNQVVDLFFGKDFTESSKEIDNQEDISSLSLSPEYLAQLAGKFKSELLGMTVEIMASDLQLKMVFDDSNAMPMIALSETEFAVSDGQFNVRYSMKNEKISGISIKPGLSSDRYEFTKLDIFEPTKKQLADYTGKYFSNELEVLYTIGMNEEDSLTLKLYNLPELTLVPSEPDVFSETTTIYSDLSFIRDASGKVTGISLSNGRTQDVMFERMSL